MGIFSLLCFARISGVAGATFTLTAPTASCGSIIVTLVQPISHKNIMRRQLRRFAPLFCFLILASTILTPRVAMVVIMVHTRCGSPSICEIAFLSPNSTS